MDSNEDTGSTHIEQNYKDYAIRKAELEAAVGGVVALWANLEAEILLSTATALKISNADACQIVSVFRTFALALDFCDRVVKVRISDQPQVARWNSITEYTRELSGDRNFIAHQGIVAHGEGRPEQVDWRDVLPKVGPTLFTHQMGNTKRDPMDVHEVREIAKDIQECIEYIMEFRTWLAQAGTPPWQDTLSEAIHRRRPRVAERRASA
ncbi:MAG: hypothetical protein AB3N22_18170 [Ruegeria sp.]